MGIVEPLAIATTLPGVMAVGDATLLWASMTGILLAAVGGIFLALPRRQRVVRPVGWARPLPVG